MQRTVQDLLRGIKPNSRLKKITDSMNNVYNDCRIFGNDRQMGTITFYDKNYKLTKLNYTEIKSFEH